MKLYLKLASLVLGLACCASTARGQGSVFTYQGRLSESGGPANGMYAMQFTLKDAASGSNSVGTPVAIAPAVAAARRRNSARDML